MLYARSCFYMLCCKLVTYNNLVILQRFIPSEFGLDPDKVQISGMDHSFYSRKADIRRLVEAEEIPYTYICCNFFMSYLLPSLVQPGIKVPPRDKITIFGDGNVKGLLNCSSLPLIYPV